MPKIPDYRFEIPEAALGLFLFAAEKSTQDSPHAPARRGLDHICIETELGKKGESTFVHAVASNGYHLAHLRWIPDPDKDVIPDGIILIDAEQAKDFLKARRPKDTRYWLLEEDGDWKVIGDNGTRMTLNGSPPEYPPWQGHMPARTRPEPGENAIPITEFALNWNLLDVFRQFSKKYLGQHGFKMVIPETNRHAVLMIPVSIDYNYSDEDKPIKVEVEYLLSDGITELEYVLMTVW
jgi:hypothetical protein